MKGASNRLTKKLLAKLHGIELLVYDFDGVLTDNKVLVFGDGREAVFCNRSDGWAIQQIKKLGIPQFILSTETNAIVTARGKKLRLPVIACANDKKRILIDYCERKKQDLSKVLYIGNDLNDFEPMKIVGISACPKDACPEIKNISKIIIKKNGGDGVVRELFNLIQKSHG